jgi:ABC-type transport system involved in multi-copper enzyme maturation permease subunit
MTAMIKAELLKLRRQRPLMAFAALLSAGAVVAFQAYLQVRHATAGGGQPYGPAGGEAGMGDLLKMQGLYFGGIAAILVGAEAGTADLSSGVFRDLAATGRSRLTLFWVRLPAALILSLSFTVVAYGLGVAGLFAYAGGQPVPTVVEILQGLGWVLLADGALTALALGAGSLSGSRALTLTAVIGWQTVGTELILREVPHPWFLLSPGLGRVAPLALLPAGMGATVAVAVIAAWALVPLLGGARRTLTRDA